MTAPLNDVSTFPETSSDRHSQAEGSSDCHGRRRLRGHHQVRGCQELVGADVDVAVEDPRIAVAPLIGGEWVALGIDGQVVAAGVDGRAGGKRAMVRVGPPLSARSAASPGSATPTRLPLTPSISPPEPPVPIRLYEPETVPSYSSPISLGCGAVGGVEGDDRIVQGGRAGKRDVETAASADNCCRLWWSW